MTSPHARAKKKERRVGSGEGVPPRRVKSLVHKSEVLFMTAPPPLHVPRMLELGGPPEGCAHSCYSVILSVPALSFRYSFVLAAESLR